VLNFEGIHNFRDLGGYPAADGRQVKWGLLYRSGTLAEASRADLEGLRRLQLHSLVDFRSALEKEEEPNRLPDPAGFEVIEIPTLDGGDNTAAAEIIRRIEHGDFDDFDPDAFMLEANRTFADSFTPQFTEFLQVVQNADGKPVLWHCSAGKDRTGFAAAILLRILGVPQQVVVDDYAMSKEYSLAARQRELMLVRLFKGDAAADKLAVIMGVEKPWLEAGFAHIDEEYGSFERYVREGLGLSDADVLRLRETLLE
jgi:protein-tyrosine phosphatase